jgi:hypothetical protein
MPRCQRTTPRAEWRSRRVEEHGGGHPVTMTRTVRTVHGGRLAFRQQ